MSDLEAAVRYAREHREAQVRVLKELLAIPTVSTLSVHKKDMVRAAEWLADRLRQLGMAGVDVLPTGGHPAVYGQWLHAAGKPTILVYGHYDVQPVDPVDEWVSGPFEGTVRGDYIYARGASDMKGQVIAFLSAVEALAAQGPLPVNLKVLIEGEEEIMSANLPALIDDHRELLGCDFLLNCDAGIGSAERPAITYALRGIAYLELEVRGPAKDLHSGVFGGAVHNPAQVLCDLIAGMHDADGRVTLPGFYDKVRALDDQERADLAKLAVADEEHAKMLGVPKLWGEKGYTTIERVGARPTLEVNGLVAGYTGQGAKTVLPARALAKLSARLVPDQDPADVEGQVRAYVSEHAPETVTCQVRGLVQGPGAVADRKSAAMRAAVKVIEEVFGVRPGFRRQGGSVPVVGLMQQKLGVDAVMLGFGLQDDGIHGPNERQHLPTFFKGIEAYIRFLCSF